MNFVQPLVFVHLYVQLANIWSTVCSEGLNE